MTKVINLFGGPGIGKSGIAAELYGKMKANHMNVELVTEVAKDFVWEERFNVLHTDQIYIFAKQHRRLDRLRGHVDYVVTDCPILMCIAYIPPNAYYKKELMELMITCAQSFDNINVFLGRDEKTHTNVGRYHNLEQSRQKDRDILQILDICKEPYQQTPVDENITNTLFNQLIAAT